MEGLIGKQIKGFKFSDYNILNYEQEMDDYIDEIGEIIEHDKSDNTIRVKFKDGAWWYYPTQRIEEFLTSNK